MHHQVIRRLGEGLRVTATAPDGLVEAIVAPNGHYMVAEQWHPEVFEPRDPNVHNMLRDFIKAAAWLAA